MVLKKHIRGYVRPLPRLTGIKQEQAIARLDPGFIYQEGRDGESLFECIRALRKGDTVVVWQLHVLAASRKSTKDKPRDALWTAIKSIEGKGATILEVESGRSTATNHERDDMIRDAIEHITSAGRAAAGRRNGPKSKGRPPIEFTAAQTEQARVAWFDIRHRTNGDALRASPEGWTMSRSHKEFGPSGR